VTSATSASLTAAARLPRYLHAAAFTGTVILAVLFVPVTIAVIWWR
jgi:hypothetical protein